ncbi:MAG TPA: sigma 54-interacting transcriptional regulator [Polyangiaceae bacterium]|jgi:formate hydrogenlyase transcriptional activator|nr:sigma 54-interacting transcriptional regulator [Polyangiaceae bacterium]
MHPLRSNAAASTICGLELSFNVKDIVGESSTLREVLRQAETVASTDATVLIHGETGTGKEMIANAIHHFSSRRSGRIVKVNTAAVPSALIESELFGHEKGAFTGAFARRLGRVELAQDGTLFLDEIGEMPLELQPKLLRLLQEREYQRLGGSDSLFSNARLVVATHRDLRAMVRAQTFREDLYYRLNVFPICLPPLRERRADIPVLARSFAENYARRIGRRVPTISPSVMESLSNYSWPGNIRELQNIIERAVILSPNGESLQVQLPHPHELEAPLTLALPAVDSLDDAQRVHILSVLESTGWVIGGPKGAAAKLGMKRTTLNFRIKKLGIGRELRSDRWLTRSA